MGELCTCSGVCEESDDETWTCRKLPVASSPVLFDVVISLPVRPAPTEDRA